MPFLKKSFCSVARCIIIINLFSIDGMRKESRFPFVYLCIDCRGNGCHLPWFFTWHATSYHKWLGKFVFFRRSSSYVSLEQHHSKVPASSPRLMQIPKSSLNITFIQWSTPQDCFSLAHCNLFFCFGVSAGFCLPCLNVNPRFLTVLSQTLTRVSSYLFFNCFVVHFLFSSHIALSFLSWCFDVFLSLPVCLFPL